jgi:hypothetical protein
MTPSDGEAEDLGEPARKPYVAPKVIFSELYSRGVGVKTIPAPSGTPDYHSTSTNSTS